MSNWRQASISAIAFALKDLPKEADKKKAIDAAYPFYERKYHPYKIWLDERRKTLLQLGLWQPPKMRRCKYHSNKQTCLLCQNTQ